jgi:acetyl-CoA acetyltransferase
MARNPKIDWTKLDEVYFGCANQAGEDNRNVARMALLLAGLPNNVPGVTLNRLCASGLNAVGAAAQAIRAGDIDFAIAGGVESMTRAPFVMGKAHEAFARTNEKAQKISLIFGLIFSSTRIFAGHTSKTSENLVGLSRKIGRSTGITRDAVDLFMEPLLDFHQQAEAVRGALPARGNCRMTKRSAISP